MIFNYHKKPFNNSNADFICNFRCVTSQNDLTRRSKRNPKEKIVQKGIDLR